MKKLWLVLLLVLVVISCTAAKGNVTRALPTAYSEFVPAVHSTGTMGERGWLLPANETTRVTGMCRSTLIGGTHEDFTRIFAVVYGGPDAGGEFSARQWIEGGALPATLFQGEDVGFSESVGPRQEYYPGTMLATLEMIAIPLRNPPVPGRIWTLKFERLPGGAVHLEFVGWIVEYGYRF